MAVTAATKYALTLRQPWASLTMAGAKDVENRTWRPPRTLPAWMLCETCGARDRLPYRPSWSRCDPPDVDHGWRRADGPFPFRLWIHAGKQRFPFSSDVVRDLPAGAWSALHTAVNGDPELCDNYPLGALLGSVLVTGCHRAAANCQHHVVDPTDDDAAEAMCSPWAERDAHHWALADPQPLPEPIPMKGRQGLWTLPDDVAVPA